MKMTFVRNSIRLLTIGLLAAIFSFLFCDPADAQNTEQRLSDLEKRLEELELRSAEFQTQSLEGRGQVRSFFNNSVSFGGFFENAITAIDGPDTEAQVSANSHLLGINIAADLHEKFRFVSQFITGLNYGFQNPHNNPNLTPSQRQYGGVTFGAIVAQGYVEYLHSAAFRVQTGLGYAPFGYALQQREVVLFKRRTGPQLANTSGADNVGIAFPLWTGVHVAGSFTLEDQFVGYDLYSFSSFNNPRDLGVGSRLWWRNNSRLTIGISSQSGKDADHRFTAFGADINTKLDRWGLTAEYARTPVSGLDLAAESYYAEPFVTFLNDSLIFYLVGDYLDHATFTSVKSGAAIADPYKKWLTGFGINWLPVPYIRLRLGYLKHDYLGDTATIQGQDRDYESYDFSAGVTF
jgi:hypothetical protein